MNRVSHYKILTGCSNASFSGSLNAIIARQLVSALYISLVAKMALVVRTEMFSAFFGRANASAAILTRMFASKRFCVAVIYILTMLILTFFLVEGIAIFTGIGNVLRGM